MVKASETIHRALTKEEETLFLNASKNEWLYEFFCFSLCTGMRIMEIGALQWKDIDYINNAIHVTKTLSIENKDKIHVTPPKSKSSKRDIPMNDTIKQILKMQREKMLLLYGADGVRMESRIFVSQYGKVVSSATFNGVAKRIFARLEQNGTPVEKFSHHAFRDTFATRYIQNGGTLQTLKTILGHSSFAMTADLYAHVMPNTKQDEMNLIEKGFQGVV
jgi:integrase